jgi:hypothetical protein
MKTDLYTKIILTIIAVVLTVNLFKSSISPAKADARKYVTLPVKPDGTINVRIVDCSMSLTGQNDPLPVKVTNK